MNHKSILDFFILSFIVLLLPLSNANTQEITSNNENFYLEHQSGISGDSVVQVQGAEEVYTSISTGLISIDVVPYFTINIPPQGVTDFLAYYLLGIDHSKTVISSIGDNDTLTLPTKINNKKGSWTQSSTLKISSSFDKRKPSKGYLKIYPPEASFERIDDGRVDTYFSLEQTSNAPGDIQLDVVSFTCVGESVLAVNGISSTLNDIRRWQETPENQKTKNISIGKKTIDSPLEKTNPNQKITKTSPFTNYIPNKLAQIFVNSIQDDEVFPQKSAVISVLPVSITRSNLAGASATSKEISTMLVSDFGCSRKFREIMQPWSIQLVPETSGNFSLSWSDWRNRLLVEW